MTTRRPVGGIVIPQQPKWHGRIAARVIAGVLKGCASTWRFETERSFAELLTEPVIFATWHNRLAVAMGFWARILKRQPHLKLGALVSASRDGGLLSAVLTRFNVQPVRGSSSRRGPQALREAATLVNSGYCVAITPDGPRGPRYHVQPGIIALAQLTGRPIIATGSWIHPKAQLRSWDRFQVPLPLAKCILKMSDPIHVPRESSEEEREQKRRALEKLLLSLNPD